MRGRAAVVLFVIVFLLVAGVVGTFLTGRDAAPEVTAPPAGDPAGSAGVVVQEETPLPTATYKIPVVTTPPGGTVPGVQTPVSTAPAATPKPTEDIVVVIPSPPATPQPVYGDALGSGSFSSDTGVGLNLQADWSARTVSSSQVEVTVSVSINSYSLHLAAMPGAVNLSLGGQYVSLDGPSVDYDGSGLINSSAGSRTFTLDLAEGESEAFHLDVAWNFGGSYQDVVLPSIECGGDIYLSR